MVGPLCQCLRMIVWNTRSLIVDFFSWSLTLKLRDSTVLWSAVGTDCQCIWRITWYSWSLLAYFFISSPCFCNVARCSRVRSSLWVLDGRVYVQEMCAVLRFFYTMIAATGQFPLVLPANFEGLIKVARSMQTGYGLTSMYVYFKIFLYILKYYISL